VFAHFPNEVIVDILY